MATFRDNQNREWVLEIDVPLARRIRQEMAVDILNLDLQDEQSGLNRVSRDPILFVEALYLLCQAQCEKRRIDPDDFGRSLKGDALGEALDAFTEALSDFSPPRQRKFLQTANATANRLLETLTGMAETRVPDALEKLDAVSGKSSPGSKESSVTPREEPCAS